MTSVYKYRLVRDFFRDKMKELSKKPDFPWPKKGARLTKFSRRALLRRAGFTSTNYLSLFLKGERNPSGPAIKRFAYAVGLSAREANYLAQLSEYQKITEKTTQLSFFMCDDFGVSALSGYLVTDKADVKVALRRIDEYTQLLRLAKKLKGCRHA